MGDDLNQDHRSGCGNLYRRILPAFARRSLREGLNLLVAFLLYKAHRMAITTDSCVICVDVASDPYEYCKCTGRVPNVRTFQKSTFRKRTLLKRTRFTVSVTIRYSRLSLKPWLPDYHCMQPDPQLYSNRNLLFINISIYTYTLYYSIDEVGY